MDIETLDAGRICNLAYATLVAWTGVSVDEGKQAVDRELTRLTSGGHRRMSLAQAKAMARDAETFDAGLVKGRVDARNR